MLRPEPFRLLPLLLLALLLSGCRWSESRRQQFREACEQQDRLSDFLSIDFRGFEREEMREVQVEQIRDGEVVERFLIYPAILGYWVNIHIDYSAAIEKTILLQDTLRFTVASQYVFTLSDFKMVMRPQRTMFEEGWGCVLEKYAVDGKSGDVGDLYLIKPGYPDPTQGWPDWWWVSDGSDAWRWRIVTQKRRLIAAILADGEESEDAWLSASPHIYRALDDLGEFYALPDATDNTRHLLTTARIANKERHWLVATKIEHRVLEERYRLFQEKMERGSQ